MDDSVATLGFVGLGVVGAALNRTKLAPELTSNAAALNSVLHLLRVPELEASEKGMQTLEPLCTSRGIVLDYTTDLPNWEDL